jgi:hypothetical protein
MIGVKRRAQPKSKERISPLVLEKATEVISFVLLKLKQCMAYSQVACRLSPFDKGRGLR